MKKADHLIQRIVTVMLFALFVATNAAAQQTGIDITGNVVDDNGEAIIGASVVVKGNSSYGTVTDFDGNFKLKVPSQSSTIVISFIGMNPSEVKVGSKRQFKVKLTEDVAQLQDVVVVGYGQQKKVSVVGAITQTDDKVLQKHEGVSNLGQALTGNLPGLITIIWSVLATPTSLGKHRRRRTSVSTTLSSKDCLPVRWTSSRTIVLTCCSTAADVPCQATSASRLFVPTMYSPTRCVSMPTSTQHMQQTRYSLPTTL